jgi:outer membrane protein assembly factor BamB
LKWELNRSIPEIPSILLYDGLIYMVRNGGLLSAVDAANGKLLYRERLNAPGQYSASPVAANGHVYLGSNRGIITVVKVDKKFEIIHQHDLKDPVLVSPAIDKSTLYVRSEKALWAFRSGK